jgi:hypothetical protein
MQPTKPLRRAKRRPRQLPQQLRPLAALVELTNLISQAEFERFYEIFKSFIYGPFRRVSSSTDGVEEVRD